MKRHEVLPAAAAELDEAAVWYEEQQPGLGQALADAYQERLASALDTPSSGTAAGHTPDGVEIRRYRLRRFARYSVLLAWINEVPTVLAFEHSSRRPGYWKDRLK